MQRETTTGDGFQNNFAPKDVGYASPALSLELSGQLLLTPATAIVLGLHAWFESAGSDNLTEPDGDQILVKDGQPPRPIASPSYELADGTQLFLGPYVGM